MKKLIFPVVLVTGVLCLAPVWRHEGHITPPCAGSLPENEKLPVELLWWTLNVL